MKDDLGLKRRKSSEITPENGHLEAKLELLLLFGEILRGGGCLACRIFGGELGVVGGVPLVTRVVLCCSPIATMTTVLENCCIRVLHLLNAIMKTLFFSGSLSCSKLQSRSVSQVAYECGGDGAADVSRWAVRRQSAMEDPFGGDTMTLLRDREKDVRDLKDRLRLVRSCRRGTPLNLVNVVFFESSN